MSTGVKSHINVMCAKYFTSPHKCEISEKTFIYKNMVIQKKIIAEENFIFTLYTIKIVDFGITPTFRK